MQIVHVGLHVHVTLYGNRYFRTKVRKYYFRKYNVVLSYCFIFVRKYESTFVLSYESILLYVQRCTVRVLYLRNSFEDQIGPLQICTVRVLVAVQKQTNVYTYSTVRVQLYTGYCTSGKTFVRNEVHILYTCTATHGSTFLSNVLSYFSTFESNNLPSQLHTCTYYYFRTFENRILSYILGLRVHTTYFRTYEGSQLASQATQYEGTYYILHIMYESTYKLSHS